MSQFQKLSSLRQMLGPGFIVAATGVGAGDLIAAAVAGQRFGLAVLWVVLLGAFFKAILNEGVSRWQLATGTTLMEGWIRHLPRWVSWYFLVYLCFWGFLVAAALMLFSRSCQFQYGPRCIRALAPRLYGGEVTRFSKG